MEVRFEGLPGRTLHIWLFKAVKNASELQAKIQARSFDPECSLINAALVADSWLLHIAAFKALFADSRGALRTRSLHGELVHNLSGTKHIGESFKRYGISANTTDIVVCRFNLQAGEEERIVAAVGGELTPLSGLANLTDLSTLHKIHKITKAEQGLHDDSGGIATRLAARDC